MQAFAAPPDNAEAAARSTRHRFRPGRRRKAAPNAATAGRDPRRYAAVAQPEDKTLYHAATVIASNYAVTLLGAAAELITTSA